LEIGNSHFTSIIADGIDDTSLEARASNRITIIYKLRDRSAGAADFITG
jgi:hypothetical protein